MLIQRRVISGLILIGFTFGCAGAPFKPGQPVEVKGSVWTRQYVQNGESIDRNNLLENLRSDPAAGAKGDSARTWELISLVPSMAGGFLIGYYAVASDVDGDTRMIGILSGVGLASIGIGMGIHSENLLEESVGIYNGSVSGTKKSIFIQPAVFASHSTVIPGFAGSWQIP